MNEDYVLICFECAEITDMPSEQALEKFGDMLLECCGEKMYKVERNKLYLLTTKLDKVKEALEQEVAKQFDA